MNRLLALTLALGACGQPRDFVGDDLGDDRVTQETPDEIAAGTTPNSFDANGTGVFASCLADPGAPVLELEAIAGGIRVHHEGMPGQICGLWEPHAEIKEGLMEIELSYTDIADQACDRDCIWLYEFDLPNLEPGEWTVVGGPVSATVRVAP